MHVYASHRGKASQQLASLQPLGGHDATDALENRTWSVAEHE